MSNIERDDPKRETPNRDNAEPKRPKLLSDKELPKHAQSNKDKDAPTRVVEITDKAEPNREKLRSDKELPT
jgi:hypothetical protein